jgi:ribosomal protein S18 acetylase RimI-like enzyme
MRQHLADAGVPFDEAHQLERVKYRLDCAQIIMKNGRDVGLLKVCRDGNPWELSQVQIALAYQGRGIGTAVLRNLLAGAVAANADVRLHVLKQNPARQLYERLGFRVVEVGDVFYTMLCMLAASRG